jgi:hypothetical protein
MERPLRGFRERREAQTLQDALERYERALDQGADPATARAAAGRDLRELERSFVLATSMPDAAAAIEPDAAFARRVAMQLRSAQVLARPAVRRRAPRFVFTPVLAGAAVIAAALVLITSFGALPGEALYAVKGAAEDGRVWLASGNHEARIRLALANERFEEVEQLIDRSRVLVMDGPGILASDITVADIADPELARLIEGALRDAGEQLEAAAEILTQEPAPKEDLDALVAATTRGRALATDVADELPNPEQPPVLREVVKLAKIEAKAKAAQTSSAVEPTPQPCPSPSATPSPTPSPSPDASATPSEPTPAPTLTPGPDDSQRSAGATETATVADEADPCATPSPSPTPSPSGEPASGSPAEPTPSAPSDEQSSAVEETDDTEPSDNDEQAPKESRRRPLSPFGELA